MDHFTPQRILVAGSGALGCVFGGFLAQQGHRVTLLGRPWMMDAVQTNGLTITGLWGEHRIDNLKTVTDVTRLIGPYDTILLCVKSWDTAATIGATAKHLTPTGLMVSLQNGLGNLEQIEQSVGPARSAGARVIFGAEILSPARVAVTVYAAPVLIGTLYPGTEGQRAQHIDALVQSLSATPIPTQATPTLPAALWAKVLYNAALNPLGALLAATYGELASSPDTRDIMDNVVAEAFTVATAVGMTLPWPTTADYLTHFYGDLVPPTANHRSSMLQDLERGRPTEVDALNGRIVTLGQQYGIATPVNHTLSGMIRQRAQALAPKGAS
jgi:2-dehydropantoate 2-reductase